jgi:hypothetical protein
VIAGDDGAHVVSDARARATSWMRPEGVITNWSAAIARSAATGVRLPGVRAQSRR